MQKLHFFPFKRRSFSLNVTESSKSIYIYVFFGFQFLSGGESEVEATLNPNAMNQTPNPWHVSFSYACALQNSVLKMRQGRPEIAGAAQKARLVRAKANSLAQL